MENREKDEYQRKGKVKKGKERGEESLKIEKEKGGEKERNESMEMREER